MGLCARNSARLGVYSLYSYTHLLVCSCRTRVEIVADLCSWQDGDVFLHGATPGTAQEHTPSYHPHLRLEETNDPVPDRRAG